MKAYSNAKLMVLMGTYYLAGLLKGSGVSVTRFNQDSPPPIPRRNSGSFLQEVMFGVVRFMQATASKAAETSIYLASSQDVEGVTGICFTNNKPVKTSLESYDEEKQRILYEMSLELLKIEPVHVNISK